MLFALGVVLFALGITVSIALHEAGHMYAAKAFGMRVRRYFIGFGPSIFSFRRGETEYGLKAIPAGGFCDIAGMTALDEVTPDEAPRAFFRKPTWQRVIVLSAGSITHFVIGMVLVYALAVSAGLPKPAVNMPIHRPGGGWLAEPDLSYDDVRLAIEYNGIDHADAQPLAGDDRGEVGGRVRFTRATTKGVDGNDF